MRAMAPQPTYSSRPTFISVVVPFRRNLTQLERCLSAITLAVEQMARSARVEVIVVADGARQDPTALVRGAGARLVRIAGPKGPAVARNHGALAARGDLLVFVDTDVVMHSDVLRRFLDVFAASADVAATFGAYDETPADPGFFSQCRNLAHSFIHQRSAREAATFWAGLGAVRTEAFFTVGGFDERFRHPSVEDIDLGYRLRKAGHRILLEPGIEGTHLKRWTFWSSLVTDVRYRGIPWTQLLQRYGAMRNDLNITYRYRACVVAAYLLVLAVAGAWFAPWLAGVAAAAIVALWTLDRQYYRFFIGRRGWLLTLGWFPFHVLHHLCNGLSFVLGTLLFHVRRFAGIGLPGAIASTAWSRGAAPAAPGTYAA